MRGGSTKSDFEMTPIILPLAGSTTGNKSWSEEASRLRMRETGSVGQMVSNCCSITWRTVREQRIRVEALAVS